MNQTLFSKAHQFAAENGANILKHPLGLMPFSLKKQLLERVFNAQFQQALEDGDLDFLEDKWLKIEVRDLDLTWFISLIDEKLVISRCELADVSFIGNMNDLILIATRKQDPDTLFFHRRLVIEGNTELGLQVKNLMDSIDFETMPKPIQKALLALSRFIEE